MPGMIVRLTPLMYRQLKARSFVEKRPMSDIVREALITLFKTKPLSPKKFREYLNEVVKSEKDLRGAS